MRGSHVERFREQKEREHMSGRTLMEFIFLAL
jgi:hypothetical protein